MLQQLPFARWMPITRNFTHGGMSKKLNGLAIHITDGVNKQLPNLGGIYATFNNPGNSASAHFCISKEGVIAQYVGLNDTAWGVGGDTHGNDDQFWISVENIALPGELLTPAQCAGVARLLRFFHENADVPLRLADNRSQQGLGYHSMFHRGHPQCPGTGIEAQRAGIITLAGLTGVLESGL